MRNIMMTLALAVSLLGLAVNTSRADVSSLADVVALQHKIQTMVERVRPATVALTSSRTGSSGSGVVVNANGLILTAAHVVQGNEEMHVVFPNGQAFIGKVLGANRTKDIAMVQLVKQRDWPFAKLGSSDKMKVGDHVVAMGHSGGYDPRRKPPVRFGRLLSKNKKGFITTDCTLIGGDSGGPLFDLEGNVVGINSSIGRFFTTNNHAGISALIADWDKLAKGETWGQLNQNPLADPDSPVMGFRFDEVRGRTGVLVTEVLRKSPARRAGMKRGDVITAIDNEAVKNGQDLLVAMNHHKPGENVVVAIRRGNQILKLKVKLSRRGDYFKR